jgi:hypothetical protein
MDDPPPILGYAHSGPAMEPREALQVIELRRPAAWGEIVLLSIGFSVTTAAFLFFLNLFLLKGVLLHPFALCILFAMGGLSYVQLRAITRVARAGRRPITLAIQDRTLLIDDVALNANTVTAVHAYHVRRVSIRNAGRSIALEPLWELKIERLLEPEINFYFVEKDPVRAELLVFDLYSGLGLST